MDWLEERLLWALRMIAFTEGLRVLKDLGNDELYCNHDPKYADCPIPQEAEDAIQKHFSFLLLSERSIAENARREVVNNVRMSTISDLLDTFRSSINWDDADCTVLLIERDLREICFSILQLRNDSFLEAPEPADIDHTTINTLRVLLVKCVPDATLRFQAIPMMWRLAASTSVSGRMACSILISVLYPRLPSHQKLQLRGLINRLSVDQFAMIRGHVLGITCPKIINMLDTAGLNWLAHCITHSSSDEDATVRMQAITACSKVIQFYSMDASATMETEEEKFPCSPDFVPASLYYPDPKSKAAAGGEDVEGVAATAKDFASCLLSEAEYVKVPPLVAVTQADSHLMYCR